MWIHPKYYSKLFLPLSMVLAQLGLLIGQAVKISELNTTRPVATKLPLPRHVNLNPHLFANVTFIATLALATVKDAEEVFLLSTGMM